jgi:hypothetical protein
MAIESMGARSLARADALACYLVPTMGRPGPLRRTTAGDYLAWEREQPEKHVFWDGEIFARGSSVTAAA